jgi:hypothetical protein
MQMEVVGVPMSFLTLSVEMPEELYDLKKKTTEKAKIRIK